MFLFSYPQPAWLDKCVISYTHYLMRSFSHFKVCVREIWTSGHYSLPHVTAQVWHGKKKLTSDSCQRNGHSIQQLPEASQGRVCEWREVDAAGSGQQREDKGSDGDPYIQRKRSFNLIQ